MFMRTTWLSMCIVFFCTFITSFAQVLYKKGSETLSFSLFSLITNYYIIGGLCLYGFGLLLLLYALKGGELSVLYPIIATGYIWVSLYSYFLFNEQVNLLRWIGIGAVVLGIACIGFGSSFGSLKKDQHNVSILSGGNA